MKLLKIDYMKQYIILKNIHLVEYLPSLMAGDKFDLHLINFQRKICTICHNLVHPVEMTLGDQCELGLLQKCRHLCMLVRQKT